MFEQARLSLSVSRFTKSWIFLPPKYIKEGALLIKEHNHNFEEAMSYVITQSFMNRYIDRNDLTEEGIALLDYGLNIYLQDTIDGHDYGGRSFEE